MGFSHDILAGQDILNEDGTVKEEYRDTTNINNQISENAYNRLNKAGISFEFVNAMPASKLNGSNERAVGWESYELRNTLNQSIYDSMKETIDIKKVTKAFCAKLNNPTLSYSDDFLWLLSSAEIWDNGYTEGARGQTMGIEGIQYKYYKNVAPWYDEPNEYLIKTYFYNGDWRGITCWLRSLCRNISNANSCIWTQGTAEYNTLNNRSNVAPGFAI